MKFKMDFKKSRIMYSLQDISPKKKNDEFDEHSTLLIY